MWTSFQKKPTINIKKNENLSESNQSMTNGLTLKKRVWLISCLQNKTYLMLLVI